MKLGIGLIGAGRIGEIHAKNLFNSKQANLVAIADINKDRADFLSKEYGINKVVSSPEELISLPEIQAVLICSSTDTHLKYIIEAAKAGKHIFCEKPLALDLNEIDEALKIVHAAGVKLQVGFNRRFDPEFSSAKKIIQENLGEVLQIKITSRDPGPPPAEYIKISGGLFCDMAIHDFDMARFLTGSEVTEVYSMGSCRIDPQIGNLGDIDTAITTLKFENGAMVVIDNCRATNYGYDQRLEIFGKGGMIQVDNKRPHEIILTSQMGSKKEKPLHFFLQRYEESYKIELNSFLNSLENKTPIECDGIDGKMAIKIALSAQKSLEENRPIKL
jgi:myo-inositol 2-dehydrogenase/D-chiro-inositol 1-dehydrogenase